MQLLFLLQNFHFAINIFGSLAIFSVAWLYYDAWTVKKSAKDLYKILGFVFLSISYFSHSILIESNLSFKLFTDSEFHMYVTNILRSLGYLMVMIGLLVDPIQKKPEIKNFLFTAPLYMSWKILGLLNPFLAVSVGVMYFRKTFFGLEKHLKKISIAFILMFVAEFGSTLSLLRNTSNIQLYEFVAPFGLVWMVEHLMLLLSFFLFASWGFSYLLRRIQTQLFILFTLFILAIFLITTATFTTLLSGSVKTENLKSLSNNAKILLSKIESKKDEYLSDSLVLSQSDEVVSAFKENKNTLNDITQKFQLSKKQQSLVIVDKNGIVIARGEDRDSLGQSYSDNLLFNKAMHGKNVVSLVTDKDDNNPKVYIQSVAIIRDGDEILGAVISENNLDNLFIDQIKKSTDLEISLYAENILSATSIITSNSQRYLGLKEELPEVNKIVLKDGSEFRGTLEFLNKDYFAVFVPLVDNDNIPIGMLFVGDLQSGVLKLASRSIALTFIITSILFVISLAPSYMISRYVSDQLR